MSLRPPLRGSSRSLRRHCLLLLLAVVLQAGCGKDATLERYFPLAPGMHWQYRVERITMDGARQLRHVVSSRVPTSYAGNRAAVRETPDGTRHYYRRTAAGIERIGERGVDGRERDVAGELILPTRLAPHAAWTSATTTSVLENSGPPWESLFRLNVPLSLDYSITTLSGGVSTPAGHFDDCVVVRGRGRTQVDAGNYVGHAEIEIETTAWYAPGIGLVRLERDERTTASAIDHGRLVMELDHWHRD